MKFWANDFHCANKYLWRQAMLTSKHAPFQLSALSKPVARPAQTTSLTADTEAARRAVVATIRSMLFNQLSSIGFTRRKHLKLTKFSDEQTNLTRYRNGLRRFQSSTRSTRSTSGWYWHQCNYASLSLSHTHRNLSLSLSLVHLSLSLRSNHRPPRRLGSLLGQCGTHNAALCG